VIGYSWAKDIEEDSIELADKEFVDETFKQKRADVIAKARLKNRERLNERQRIEVEKMTKTLLQGGEKMGEFVSNIARVLDGSLERKFNEGIQQGEYRTKVEIAKKLILKGESDEDIAEVTELAIEEIRKLRKELAN